MISACIRGHLQLDLFSSSSRQFVSVRGLGKSSPLNRETGTHRFPFYGLQKDAGS